MAWFRIYSSKSLRYFIQSAGCRIGGKLIGTGKSRTLTINAYCNYYYYYCYCYYYYYYLASVPWFPVAQGTSGAYPEPQEWNRSRKVQGSTWISSLEVDLDDGNLMFLAQSISHLISSHPLSPPPGPAIPSSGIRQ